MILPPKNKGKKLKIDEILPKLIFKISANGDGSPDSDKRNLVPEHGGANSCFHAW